MNRSVLLRILTSRVDLSAGISILERTNRPVLRDGEEAFSGYLAVLSPAARTCRSFSAPGADSPGLPFHPSRRLVQCKSRSLLFVRVITEM